MDYREIKALSQSSLKLLDQNPEYFYNIVERWLIGEIELPQNDPSDAQKLGDMVDIRLTGNVSDIAEKYASVKNAPTGQMLDFVNESYKLISLGIKPKEAAQQAYEIVGFKRDKLETVMERFKTEGKLYYDSLVRLEGRKAVPEHFFSLSETMVNDLRSDRFAAKYVNQETDFEIDVFHQVEIVETIAGLEVKGMIDKVIIDHKNKTIQLIDYKTSSEANFKKSFIQYRYDIQAALYTNLARLKYISEINFRGYKVLPFMFIVAYSIGKKPEIWKVSEIDLDTGKNGRIKNGIYYKGYVNLMFDYRWHKQSGLWEYKREIYESKGVRLLNCYDE